MKVTMTHKIIIAALVGSGISYLMHRRPKAKAPSKSSGSSEPTNSLAINEPQTLDGKVEYIIENIRISENEEMSGFSGGRFYYNPRLGYSLPKGRIPLSKAGESMILDKDDTYSHEIYFSAEGSEPSDEAIQIISSLEPSEINLTYEIVKENNLKGEENIDLVETVKSMDLGVKLKKVFADRILPRLKDVKALKKNPNWGKSWKNNELHRKFNKKAKNGKSSKLSNNNQDWSDGKHSLNQNKPIDFKDRGGKGKKK